MEKDNCPHCSVSLVGGPIPEESLKYYNGTHWKREIGMEYPDKYDGIWEYMCPDCKGTWPSEIQERINSRLKDSAEG